MTRVKGRAAPSRRRRMPSVDRLVPLVAGALAISISAIFMILAIGGDYDPGSVAGVTFGIAGAAAIVIVMLYSVRRALPAVRQLGRTKTYLDVHIHGGLLFALLMLLHTGFAVPRGLLLIVLWSLSLWVVMSGLIGVALQRTIPRVLDATSSFEVNLQRIPELIGELRSRAENVAVRAGPAVQSYYARELAPDMAAPRSGVSTLMGSSRVERYRSQELEILRRTLPERVAPMLDEMFQLHNTKLEMDRHYTLQRVLRYWLYLHLPTAIALLGLVVVHVFLVLYF